MFRSDLPIARGGAPRSETPHEPQLGPAHDHDKTGLGAPVMEPSAATRKEIEGRRATVLRFWIVFGAVSAAFVPALWLGDLPNADRTALSAVMAGVALLAVVRGYLQYCRVNLLTIYENGIAPPVKPHLTFSRSMDFHVPFTAFSRIEVEENDIDRKELAEQIDYRFVFHYADGGRLVLGPSILGRSPSKEQLTAFYNGLKEALGNSVPERVELRKVFPDGKRPVASISSRALALRVGPDLKEFPWKGIRKLRVKPAKLGTGKSFEAFDVETQGGWVKLEAARIPEMRKADLLTFIEELLRIARALKVEILQE